MTNEFKTPENPAEIAAPMALAEHASPGLFAKDPESYGTLSTLEAWARDLDFTDRQYFVDSQRSFAIPASFESSADETVTYHDMFQLSFEGVFRGYSKIMIGRIVGAGSVRAYCLTFEEVTLLPFFDEMPEEDILHVPALAVNDIQQTG